MATARHTPHGRGYETALSYFGHGNYQWGQIEWGAGGGGNVNRTVPPGRHRDPMPGSGGMWPRDLWDTTEPALALSDSSRDEGIYQEVLFGDRLKTLVTPHAAGNADADTPLFLVYAARIAHYPIQAPVAYQELPHIAAIETPHRMVYHAQIEFLDGQLGNLTDLYKASGMWDNTLMVLHSDNGGYTKHLGPCSEKDPIMGVTCMTGEAGASNHPLRGGKYSFFEGGIRANSFVSGGYLPADVRGTTSYALMHVVE